MYHTICPPTSCRRLARALLASLWDLSDEDEGVRTDTAMKEMLRMACIITVAGSMKYVSSRSLYESVQVFQSPGQS